MPEILTDILLEAQTAFKADFIERETAQLRANIQDRNNRDRYTNYTEGCTLQSIVDTSESAVVFLVKDA